MKFFTKTTIVLLTLVATFQNSFAQDKNPIEGRWDLVINKNGEELPGWLEIGHSGYHTYIGRFVYAFGSARPISEVKQKDGKFNFSIPLQWEEGYRDMAFEGMIYEDGIKGTMIYADGSVHNWTGVRAPEFAGKENIKWNKPIKLINENDLTGWVADKSQENLWTVEDGILKSSGKGANIWTDQEFMDFKLHVEFKYPEGSNSGIYLRGRYEVQIMDSYEQSPASILFGGVYGFLEPNQMAAKKAGEWQSYDITLIGRRVTIVANGKDIIVDQTIPGITGGAINSREGEPGPIYIQGDHGAIEFRNITISTPK